MIEIIKAPWAASRMSDFMTELPNGILNKVLCGVGGTHISLSSKSPYIIAVPTIELIQNKCHQYKNVLGLWGTFTNSEVQKYLKELPKDVVPKIMVTYNGLERLNKILSITCNPYKDYKLLIDEHHELLCAYSFRDKCIDSVLRESLQFEDKCFLSATPINPTYCPPQLRDIKNYTIEWGFTRKIIPTRIKTNKPYMAAVNIIKQYKAGGYCMEIDLGKYTEKSYEAYFFINSVKAIRDIIGNANLTDKEVKIICADNDKNRASLEGFTLSKVSDPNKPFTFVTSKSFVGTDFYSETGVVYVISNVANNNSLLEIGTEIFQISGRIRNEDNPFRDNIVHIYNTGASELSKEDFEKSVKLKTEKTNGQIALFQKISSEEKTQIIDRFKKDESFDYTYYNAETDNLEFNELKLLNERFEYEIVRETYTNGITLRDAYKKHGFDVTEGQYFDVISDKFITGITSIQFKEVMKEYCELIDARNNGEEDVAEERITYLENLNPTIKELVEILGTGKIRTAKYGKKTIENLAKDNSIESQSKLVSELNKVFKPNIIYLSSDVKIKLQEIYKKLGFNKKANATDLAKYYKIDKKIRKIKGKVCNSIIVLN